MMTYKQKRKEELRQRAISEAHNIVYLGLDFKDLGYQDGMVALEGLLEERIFRDLLKRE